jgi:hypothetical protein
MYHNINGSPESHDDVIRRAVAQLRAPLPIDSALDARIMAAVRAEGQHIVRTGSVGGRRAVWGWMVSLACVSLATVLLLGTRSHTSATHTNVMSRAVNVSPATIADADTTAARRAVRTLQKVRFEFVTHELQGIYRVAIVGSFNGWDKSATPLYSLGRGHWAADVPLLPGRYTYQFVINGQKWVPDPGALRDAGTDFGTSNSVVTIAAGGVT